MMKIHIKKIITFCFLIVYLQLPASDIPCRTTEYTMGYTEKELFNSRLLSDTMKLRDKVYLWEQKQFALLKHIKYYKIAVITLGGALLYCNWQTISATCDALSKTITQLFKKTKKKKGKTHA